MPATDAFVRPKKCKGESEASAIQNHPSLLLILDLDDFAFYQRGLH
jgi:hypothetical protein